LQSFQLCVFEVSNLFRTLVELGNDQAARRDLTILKPSDGGFHRDSHRKDLTSLDSERLRPNQGISPAEI
jgi:hypothetical protein